MSMDFFLRVLLPPHDQSRVPAGRHQVLIEQLVLRNYKTEAVSFMMIITITVIFITNNKEIMAYKC